MTKRALISVSDKSGVVQLAKGLVDLGYQIVSTGGTMTTLQGAGVKCINISDITGFPECLDGRVKTLHPAVHAGLLAKRNREHLSQITMLGINPIDVVVVNLYPFRATVTKPDCTLENAVENIDIGGPTMLRSAAKNYQAVTVVVDPRDYDEVLRRLVEGAMDEQYRFLLMTKVFAHTAHYDAMISQYMSKQIGADYGETMTMAFDKVCDLRYGENPHQRAAFYQNALCPSDALATAEKLGGKELSYNNIADTDGAISTLREFERPSIVAVKHANPCGVASADSIFEAYMSAYQADPVSIFGGIVAANRKIDRQTAEEMVKIFLEIVVAPDFDDDALQVLRTKPNLRILRLPALANQGCKGDRVVKHVYGGLLVQDADNQLFEPGEVRCVTKAQVSPADLAELTFGYVVCKHVKSNGIVVSKGMSTVGVGVGQTNRIFAANQALEHAGERARGGYMASDAFFPFADCVEAAAAAGIKAIIQPGGSLRDQESIDACDRHGIAMVFVGKRHFLH